MSSTPRVETITLGDELLLGIRENAHLTYLGNQLAHHGLEAAANLVIKDDPEEIRLFFAESWKRADVVITTAKLFGRPAPRIVTKEILDQMSSGSIVVDLAAETGGNVEGVRTDEEVVTENGVRIIGHSKLECMVPRDASQTAFLEHFWDEEAKTLNLDLEDEIMQGCLITHDGAIVHERFKEKD